MEYKAPANREMQPSCVVGIGASAGGLEALQQMLTFLPSNTGMAFVIIQHLAPNHKSLLTDILGKYTVMPVLEAQDGMRVERNHVYMIPPKYNIEIISDVLRLKEYDHAKMNHPIDIFFRSLASAYENRAVAVILSGTGSDGTNGIRSIKDQNGLILVQTPESAKFDGMPRNAIATGLVDMIQNPDSIAREMAHIAASMADASGRLQLTDSDLLTQVFSILKAVTNIDYAYYKQTTILRRIERRLVVTHNRNLREYVNYLSANPEEAKVLAKEVLIGVTSFFRDPEYFEVLKESVIRPLVAETPRSRQIRVWVAGCSTGEEAYSIAILFTEIMEEMNCRRDIKIFATDLDADAITTATRGVYSDNIIEDVSVLRLSRYFNRKGNKYQIRHDIRQMIIFAQHNVFQDPPFGKLDLISCRNLLIYFQSVLQRNLFAIFHMALNDRGFLFLGRSESVFDYDDVFRVLNSNERIFIHNAGGKAPAHDKITYSMQNFENTLPQVQLRSEEDAHEGAERAGELETSVLETLMPMTVLVNEKNELWRTYGDSAEFLSIPKGTATLDIFSLLRTDLRIAVSTALRESRKLRDKVVFDNVPVQIGDEPENLTLVAQPIYDKNGDNSGYTAVSFLRGHRKLEGDIRQYQVDTAAAQRISNLEHDLKLSQDSLKQTVSELESVNAELQAANEELLTANEELQSSNEELQSVNEELYTVNSEYQSKVTELAGLNDDLANFLSTTLVGILMVDRNLNIRKFTEYIVTEFHVAEQDVGRSLRYIAFNFPTIDLIGLCRDVLKSVSPIERNCASVSGKTYLLRIAPYQVYERKETAEGERASSMFSRPETEKSGKPGMLRGLVITFVDTTKQVDAQQQIEEILETSRINAGKVVSVSSTVKEDETLNNLNAIIRERAREAGITFQSKISGCRGKYVLMDTDHVERILMNLLSNAVKFTPEGGTVRFDTFVKYTEDQAQHTYVIKDTGRGMSEEFQRRMFLPFEQESGEEIREGTGLGLYICRNLVELLGGTISCDSLVGRGTTFTVVMNYSLATEEQIRLSNRRTRTYEDQILFGKNVLLAEDNQTNAEVIMRILASKGVRSELVRDGQEAVEMFRMQGEYHYQAILMDIMMPVKNGLQAARDIRALMTADAQSIPIIALTADVLEETEERCADAGMTSYLSKPIEPERLLSTLAAELENQFGH